MTSASTATTGTLAPLTEHVHRCVSARQAAYLRRENDALAAMAKLRRGIAAPPGRLPELWELTLGGLPPAPWKGPGEGSSEAVAPATAWERAAYDAMTLHASHQQSRTLPMHRRGAGSLGNAAQRLGVSANAAEAVRSRFHLIATAQDHAARLTYLRALIGQLRAHDIALDYARLTSDLYWLDTGRFADGVLLDWARDYHRQPPKTETTDSPETGDNK
ncbi:type I-E CRISPR-associated protein Cse2/CasB [Nocardia thailandica]